MEDSSLMEYLILGGIAAFLIMQLYKVLGTNPDEFDDNSYDSSANEQTQSATIIDFPADESTHKKSKEYTNWEDNDNPPEVIQVLAKMEEEDPTFSETGFKQGACAAFERIISAYANEKLELLENLLSDKVYSQFEDAIKERETANEALSIEIVGITDCSLLDAEIKNGKAAISVKFVSEQISTVNDRETYETIGGSDTAVNTIQDIWTFERKIRTENPNWTLIATSAPE